MVKKNEDKKGSSCRCPYCDKELKDGSDQCNFCSIKIVYCKNCGSAFSDILEKCPDCGAEI